ncbi:unnamed protein product [Strongylus vulgaris]|uniref:Uncharacterized protein n=1 Tax=Strongylus vulgaris TaxID=40348 RepID=A0A3P7ITW9_STRVU|nr:unnamed protein product [Strongylus vulgaris]
MLLKTSRPFYALIQIVLCSKNVSLQHSKMLISTPKVLRRPCKSSECSLAT